MQHTISRNEIKAGDKIHYSDGLFTITAILHEGQRITTAQTDMGVIYLDAPTYKVVR